MKLDDRSAQPHVQPLLKDSAALVRVRAALLLIQWGENSDALQALMEASKNGSVRSEVYRLVFANPNGELVPLLRDALFHGDAKISKEALIALRKIGAKAGPLALELLADKDKQKQNTGAELLMEMGRDARPWLPEVRRRLPELDPTAQGRAVTAIEQGFAFEESPVAFWLECLKLLPQRQQEILVRLRSYKPVPKEAAAALSEILEKGTLESRVVAAETLVSIAPEHPGVLKALQDGLDSKFDMTVQSALKALDKLGPAAEPAYARVLELFTVHSPKPFSGELRALCVPMIARMGKRALPTIKAVLRKATTQTVNNQAAIALGRIGPDAVPTILRLLEPGQPELDRYMTLALQEMPVKPVEVLEDILPLMHDKNGNTRRSAADYLAKVKPATEQVNEALWKGLDDFATSGICFAALKNRSPETRRWTETVKRFAQRASSVDILVHLYELDPGAAEETLPNTVMSILTYRQQQLGAILPLLAIEKRLPPVMPKVYELLDDESPAPQCIDASRLSARRIQPARAGQVADCPQ